MAITIAQLANLGLTTQQQSKLQQAFDMGTTLASPGGTYPDVSAVNLAVIKGVLNFCDDLRRLETTIRRGAEYVRKRKLSDAATATDVGSPATSL